MEKYYYEEFGTNKRVYDYEAEDYALEHLGITIKPLGKAGTLTLLQVENIEETVDWFFSGNWAKIKVKE